MCTAIWDADEYRHNSLIESLRSPPLNPPHSTKPNIIESNIKLSTDTKIVNNNHVSTHLLKTISTSSVTANSSGRKAAVKQPAYNNALPSTNKNSTAVVNSFNNKTECASAGNLNDIGESVSKRSPTSLPQPVLHSKMLNDQTSRVQRLINITQKRDMQEKKESQKEDTTEHKSYSNFDKTVQSKSAQKVAKTIENDSISAKETKEANITYVQPKTKDTPQSTTPIQATEENMRKTDIIDITPQHVHVVTDTEITEQEATSSGNSSKYSDQSLRHVKRNRKEIREKQPFPMKMVSVRDNQRENKVTMPEIVAIKVSSLIYTYT